MADSARPVELAPARLGVEEALERARASSLAFDLALVGLVAFVLGLIRLGKPSLWLDESLTATSSPIATFTGGFHWLYYSVEWPWRHLVGDSEWTLRFPSVVGSMVACGLLVVLGRRFFDRSIALVAGILLATSPFFVKWSQQARGYTILVALALAATLALLRASERNTRGAWALYGLALSAVIVWHPVGGLLLLPAQLVLLRQHRERVFPHALLAGVVVMLLGVPWAAQIALRSTGQGVEMNWLKFPSADVAARAFLDVSGAAGLGFLVAGLGLVLLVRRGQTSIAAWLGTWALAPFVLALAISVVRPIYLDRYLLVASPAFALLAAVAIVRLAPPWRAAVLAAVVVASGVGLVRWYGTGDRGNWRGEDWRDAVATVRARQGDAAIVVAPWQASPAATYYGAKVVSASRASSIWVLTWSETKQDLTPVERRGIGLAGHRRVEKLQFGSRVTAQLWRRP
jgi:mannosyltransferase